LVGHGNDGPEMGSILTTSAKWEPEDIDVRVIAASGTTVARPE